MTAVVHCVFTVHNSADFWETAGKNSVPSWYIRYNAIGMVKFVKEGQVIAMWKAVTKPFMNIEKIHPQQMEDVKEFSKK